MIRPLHDYCLIVRSKPETITSSGLHIPESAATSAANRGHLARVLATGPGRRTNDGLLLPMSVQAGDEVIIGKYQSTTAEVEVGSLDEVTGKEVREWLMSLDVDPDSDILLMLRESEILALVREQEKDQEVDEELEDVVGEQTADPEEAFQGRNWGLLSPTEGESALARDAALVEQFRQRVIDDPEPEMAPPSDEIIELAQALKESFLVGAVSMGGYPLRRRDELAEERASRYVREDGTPK